MIVVTIIGILAALAISTVGIYRQTALDARAKTDLGTLVIAQEAYYTQHDSYHATGSVTGPTNIAPLDMFVSKGVQMEVILLAPDRFEATATCQGGTGAVFSYDNMTDTIVGD